MDLFGIVGALPGAAPVVPSAEEASGLAINGFWIIVSSLNFIVFLVVLNLLFGGTIRKMLAERRARIEQGLADAEAARVDREKSAAEAAETIAQARREAKEIIDRAQKVADETREAEVAATREELDRLRAKAAAEVEAEKQRALADLLSQVADLALAAAGHVVGETMSDARQRRLVEEFLRDTSDLKADR
ncbi:MAG: F-type H+-transporting ATPase subunit b [Chloroflexota bacterium]|nr:F-type H+-transporting ATPase subunit b [Chloroflexota bacterium]